MFDKLKKAVQNIAKDIGKNVAEQVSTNNSNQAYENLRDTRYEYNAVIRKAAFGKYEGRLVDLPTDRGKADNCTTYEELLAKLTDLLTAEFEICKKYNQPFPTKMDTETIKKKYPPSFDWKIITISPRN